MSTNNSFNWVGTKEIIEKNSIAFVVLRLCLANFFVYSNTF